jgi:predicted TIM-barrel fold metal-dependent hydrolase
MSPTASEEIRRRLSHPVIDADGHTVELLPALSAYLREEGLPGAEVIGGAGVGFGDARWYGLTPEERQHHRAVVAPWWALPAENTLDAATASLPALLHERLPSFGIDFAVVYPTLALACAHLLDDEARRAACRAVNRYHADAFAGLGDRLRPAAVIPMGSPEEATQALTHAVHELGFKAVMIAGFAERRIPAAEGAPPELARPAVWLDTFGIDSLYDYDPLWSRCIDLGVAVASHSGSMGWGSRQSITSYMYNHIGHFGAAGEALCKSLFFGGVTRRFPELRVAFLEGGVHWAVGLLGDLLSRWEKRNRDAVRRYDPARLDRARFAELWAKYGGPLARFRAPLDAVQGRLRVEPHDDFARAGIERPEDIRDAFVGSFFFGCEADDPMVATAFDRRLNPFGAQLRAFFSSDIGHWDVPDMTEVLAEAWEQVEEGRLDEAQFRDFAFANAARFYTDADPDFFAGTAVEGAVRELLAGDRGSGAEPGPG